MEVWTYRVAVDIPDRGFTINFRWPDSIGDIPARLVRQVARASAETGVMIR